MSAFPREIQVVLVCKTLLQVDEPVMIGIQDKSQNVHAGTRNRDGSFEFKFVIEARGNGAGEIDFAGPCVHGKATARFAYLSWKRATVSDALWVQRVKVPFLFTAADLRAATELHADITGRRPHASEPISWKILGAAGR